MFNFWRYLLKCDAFNELMSEDMLGYMYIYFPKAFVAIQCIWLPGCCLCWAVYVFQYHGDALSLDRGKNSLRSSCLLSLVALLSFFSRNLFFPLSWTRGGVILNSILQIWLTKKGRSRRKKSELLQYFLWERKKEVAGGERFWGLLPQNNKNLTCEGNGPASKRTWQSVWKASSNDPVGTWAYDCLPEVFSPALCTPTEHKDHFCRLKTIATAKGDLL